MKLIPKTKLGKVFFGVVIIVFLSFFASLALDSYRQCKGEKRVGELEKQYREDTYGGSTPEETLHLFIDALKAGDINLAAKYFVLEKQEKMKQELEKSKENDVLKLLIQDLEKDKIGKELSPNAYQFNTYNNGVAEFSYDLVLNPMTKRWKLESL